MSAMKSVPLSIILFLLSMGLAHGQLKSVGVPEVKGKIDALLKAKAMGGTKVSVLVESLHGGKVIYAASPDQALHPASNTKLVTTAIALETLGAAYRWRTELAVGSIENGIADHIYLIGRGDPRFVSESLWKLVDDARFNGLKRVKGDLIVDDSHFTAERMAPGFNDKDQDSAYRAATGAASLNFNSVSIQLKPGRSVGEPPIVRIRPDSGHIVVKNTARTVKRGRERLRLSARADGDGTMIELSGTIPINHRGLTTRRRIDNPSAYAGAAAKLFLKRAGIAVDGQIKVGKAPSKRRRLSRVWSRTMAEIINDVNKLSNNFMAEHLVRTLGVERGKAGDWAQGTRVVSDALKSRYKLSGFKFVNGSGLFGKTAFSARHMVTILRKMATINPPLPEYAASLAVNGVDGTLKRRMKGMERGLVRAKTGTLDGVVCLSGYLRFANGKEGIFSILINDIKGRPWPIWKIQDQILDVLTRHTLSGL